MKDIGANAYRVSIAWPPIFPEGAGKPNPKGVDFYSRLVDEMLAKGIEPFATLYHSDLPQALQDRYGGWQSNETAKAFAEYAGYVAQQLGDRVKHYFTINEFASFLDRSLVSVPAGVLAQAGIENFATREQILVQTTLRLRYDTSVEQLRRILAGIRRLSAESPRLEAGTSRIRLIDFGERAVDLELFAYVLTADAPEFLAVREELLLAIAAIVEASGSGFAQPTQFLYLDGKPGADAPARAWAARELGARGDVRLAQPIADAPADDKAIAN